MTGFLDHMFLFRKKLCEVIMHWSAVEKELLEDVCGRLEVDKSRRLWKLREWKGGEFDDDTLKYFVLACGGLVGCSWREWKR